MLFRSKDSDPLHASGSKSSAEEMAAERTGFTGTSSDIVGQLKDGVSSALAWIDSTAEESRKVLGIKKETLEKKLGTKNKTASTESLTASTSLSSNEDWLSRYVYLPFLSVLIFVVEHTLVLYLVLALLLFFVVKVILRYVR